MARKVRLASSREILAILNSEGVRRATVAAADAVAINARADAPTVGGVDGGEPGPIPVTTSLFQTDRPHAVVALAHPAGDAVQAKYGLLTKAAAEAGLDVRGGGE